ncbi:hypothetical protein ACTFIZ_000317 [Dictyostelium cf. discoideum]
MRLFLLLITFIALFGAINAFSGVDISQGSSVGDFQCMINQGFEFAIIRGYMETGQVDPEVVNSIACAREAGVEYVDTYLFPCFNCGNPQDQGPALVNYLSGYNANYGMVWLDIESSDWSGDQSANVAFFEGLISGLQSVGAHIGVYTSASQWIPIMGGYTGGSEFPLWYANWDGVQSFDDFSAFGGWSTPAIKQYNDGGSNCGVGYDFNW